MEAIAATTIGNMIEFAHGRRSGHEIASSG
jgi:hypothetical protein